MTFFAIKTFIKVTLKQLFYFQFNNFSNAVIFFYFMTENQKFETKIYIIYDLPHFKVPSNFRPFLKISHNSWNN